MGADIDVWLRPLGALVLLGMVGVLVVNTTEDQHGEIKRAWPQTSILVLVYMLLVWRFQWQVLTFFGAVGLACLGYYAGRAIINQAHSDLEPDDSDGRRRTYKTVQVVVVIGITWAIGSLLEIDWSEVWHSDF